MAIICVAACVACLLMVRREPEPTYGGKTLTDWVDRYANAYSQQQRAFLRGSKVSYTGVDSEAEAAILAIGTNAFPVVLRWLHFEQDNSSVRLFYWLGLNRLPSTLRNRAREIAFRQLAQRRAQEAIYVLQLLGPQSSLVGCDLLRLCNKPAEPDTAYRCLSAFGAMGTNALPHLMKVIQDANHPYRGMAVRQVEDVLRNTPRSQVPLGTLLPCLRDRDSSLVVLASQLLCESISDRTPAIPFLQANLLSADPTVRAASSNALLVISKQMSPNHANRAISSGAE